VEDLLLVVGCHVGDLVGHEDERIGEGLTQFLAGQIDIYIEGLYAHVGLDQFEVVVIDGGAGFEEPEEEVLVAVLFVLMDEGVGAAAAGCCKDLVTPVGFGDGGLCLFGKGEVEALVGFGEDALGEAFVFEDVVEECFITGGDGSFDLCGEVQGFLFCYGFVGQVAGGQQGCAKGGAERGGKGGREGAAGRAAACRGLIKVMVGVWAKIGGGIGKRKGRRKYQIIATTIGSVRQRCR
jgi:hypothetical protein